MTPPEISNPRELVAELRALPEFKPIKPRQRRFILAFVKTHSITGAAELSAIPWVNHYSWLKRSEEYRQAFTFAKEIAADYAEGDVYQRAFIGEEVTRTSVNRAGEVITEKYKDKSDVLAIFMLKGLKPQYRDTFSVNQFAGPVQLNVKYGETKVINPLKTGLINEGKQTE